MITNLVLLLALGAIGERASAPASAPAVGVAEAKLVDEMFGKQIAQALASAEGTDNIQVAGDMLKAAQDTSNPESLRLALVQQILRVLRDVLTPEASRIIHASLQVQQKLQGVDSDQELQAELEIFTTRSASARRLSAEPDIRLEAAREVVQLSLQLAKLQADAGKGDAASATLSAARPIAVAAKLAQEALQIDAALQQIAAQKARAGKLAALQQKVSLARQANNAEQLRAAQVQLGLFYLLSEGDLRKAAAELAGTNHSYELPLKALVEFLDNPQGPPPDVCNSIAEAVMEMAKSAENPKVQATIASAGQQMCQASLAQNAQGLAATKTKLLLAQLEKLTTESPADKLTRFLKAAYGSFEGRLEKLSAGPGVSITYDFRNSRQLADWETRSGKWEANVARGMLLSAPAGGQARLDSRLRFRGDQPLTLTFQASGKQDLDAIFSFRRNGQHDVDFWYGSRGLQNVVRIDSRPQFISKDSKDRIDPGQTYRISIAWNGQGSFTWSVNGKQVAEVGVPPSFAPMPLTVCLVSLQQPITIKDVKIEGVVIESPNAAQPTSSAASTPEGGRAAAQPPPAVAQPPSAVTRPAGGAP